MIMSYNFFSSAERQTLSSSGAGVGDGIEKASQRVQKTSIFIKKKVSCY
jgi:hypothetical protein